jgi:hypothetical protein
MVSSYTVIGPKIKHFYKFLKLFICIFHLYPDSDVHVAKRLVSMCFLRCWQDNCKSKPGSV